MLLIKFNNQLMKWVDIHAVRHVKHNSMKIGRNTWSISMM